MKELQVPTHSVTVEVFTDSGERLEGELFVNDPRYADRPLDELLMVLNDERRFLPFLAHAPEAARSILSKAHILRVRPAGGVTDPDRSDDHARACTLHMNDGTALSGRLYLETPLAASRLVDKLNQSPAFLQLLTDHGVEFVRGRHVACVTETAP